MKHTVIGMDIGKNVFQLHAAILAGVRSCASSCAGARCWNSTSHCARANRAISLGAVGDLTGVRRRERGCICPAGSHVNNESTVAHATEETL